MKTTCNEVGPGKKNGDGDVLFPKVHDDKPARNVVIAALAAEYADWIVHQRNIRRLAREFRASVRNQSIAQGKTR